MNCSFTSAFLPCKNLKGATCVNDVGLCHDHNTLSHYPPYNLFDTDRPDSALSFVRGMSRLAKIAWILRGSIHSVRKRLVIVAIDALRPVPDLFNNFDARILRNPFASTLEGTPRSFCPQGCVPYHFPIYLLENCVWDVLHWPVKQRTQAVFLWTWVFISELCHDVVSYRQDTSPIIFTEIMQSRVDLPWHNKVRKPFPALIRWINPSRVAEALLNHKSFAQ